MIKKISGQSEFDKEVDKGIVVVEFFSKMCGPCKYQLPILEKLGSERKDIKIIQVDAVTEFKITQKFGVQALPTMIIFKDRKIKEFLVGLQSKEQLEKALSKYE